MPFTSNAETVHIETFVPQALKEIFHPVFEQIIERHQMLALTLEQSETFLNALANPPLPNDALRAAYKRQLNAVL